MATIKTQQWLPDTHPGHVLEIEWEYDNETGRDSGREHRGISVHYPDGTYVHRDKHGAEIAHQHYLALRAEHVIKNQAYAIIANALPAHMKASLVDHEGQSVLDEAGQPRLRVSNEHRPRFNHLGGGKYEFAVAGIDHETHRTITEKLAQFGGHVALLSPV